ncbi:hypothetical protein [Kribbella lupini]|uniref:Peptidase M48-like protein n=1 Tax=Kribbella lupini TaxID=291602 RepID=A0ABP4L4D3_9ACTN
MKKSLAASATLLTLALTGGLAATSSPALATAAGTSQARATSGLTPAETKALAAELKTLTAGTSTVAAQLKTSLDLDGLGGAVDEVIDPSAYSCNAATPVRTWLNAQSADWTPEDRDLAAVIRSLDPVLNDAVLWPQDAGSSYGVSGEFTRPVTHTFRDLGRFWDIDSTAIRLTPLHGAMLTDRAKLFRVFNVGYGLPASIATAWADEVATAMNQPKFRFGNHPYFTFNAFAFQGLTIPGFGVVPPQIVMGDGVLAGFQALGFADVTAQAVLAHEYGHHVQFQRDLFRTTLTGPEATRRTELMADAFGAYFLTHARGDALQAKRIQEFNQVFFQLGDCGFTSANHHGTPNQRLRSAAWGYSVAANAANQGHVLPSLTFASLFDQKLPELVAPDA